MAPPMKTFQLLEINVISAQDLEPVSKKMKTYATAWINPKKKLSSCVDADGHTNPTWNDKFVFRVEEEFLRRDTSSIMIEIYAGHWFKDVLIGTVGVLVGNLIPPPDIRTHQNGYIGMRFVALQIRRPSGRPQGIINLGVAVLDPSLRSMPLYTQPAMSAVGYRDVMNDPKTHHLHQNDTEFRPPMLLRSRSEFSELVSLEEFSPRSSMLIVKSKPKVKESSILSITECMVPLDQVIKKPEGAKGKASSVINASDLLERPRNGRRAGKASSVVSDTAFQRIAAKNVNEIVPKTLDKNPNPNFSPSPNPNPKLTIGKSKNDGYDYGGAQGQTKFKKAPSMLSESEVGPSPSEVAAMMIAERRYPLEDNQSSFLDGWSVDESVEGLKSKLERWRMDLPPMYDRGGYSSSSYKSSSRSTRRYPAKEESGLFSCFGTIFGMRCQCVCGKPKGTTVERRSSPSTTPGGRSSFL